MSDVKWEKHTVFGRTLQFSVPERHDDTMSEILSLYWKVASADMQKTDAGEDFLWLSFENTVFSIAKKFGVNEDAVHVLCRTHPEFQMRIHDHTCSMCSQPYKWATRSGAIATLKEILKHGSAQCEPCTRAERVATHKAKVRARRGAAIKEGRKKALENPWTLPVEFVAGVRSGTIASVLSTARDGRSTCRAASHSDSAVQSHNFTTQTERSACRQ